MSSNDFSNPYYLRVDSSLQKRNAMSGKTPDQTLTAAFLAERNKPLPIPETEQELRDAIIHLPVESMFAEVAGAVVNMEGVLAAGFLKDILRRTEQGQTMVETWVDKYFDESDAIEGWRLHFISAKLEILHATLTTMFNPKRKLSHPKVSESLKAFYASM